MRSRRIPTPRLLLALVLQLVVLSPTTGLLCALGVADADCCCGPSQVADGGAGSGGCCESEPAPVPAPAAPAPVEDDGPTCRCEVERAPVPAPPATLPQVAQVELAALASTSVEPPQRSLRAIRPRARSAPARGDGPPRYLRFHAFLI